MYEAAAGHCEEEYEEVIKEMQEEYKRKSTKGKQGISNSMVKHLMDKMRLRRLKVLHF